MILRSQNSRRGRASIVDLAAFLVTCALVLLIAHGQAAAQKIVTRANGNKHAGEFVVPIHQSEVLQLEVPFSEVLVGNEKIADVMALTDRKIYVLGKALGTTSLTIYGRGKRLIAVADLVVSQDIEGLKARLFQVMPDEEIEVRPVNDSILLSGAVSSGVRLSRILAVAERYAPGKVTNLLTLKGSQQVMLSVRFAEVSRSVVKELGLNTSFNSGRIAINSGEALMSGLFSSSAFVTGILGSFTFGATTLRFLFDALERKGVVKTLAEPNLIALSGDTASFLAGGEFPVPVARDNDDGDVTITIEFKEFGISLAFTPTVLDDGLINIVVAPEVSSIDSTNAVTVSGFSIPGLKTRRAKTTVELRDGQSFAIAGLIQSDFEDTVRQFPGLGDIPILGGLLRRSDFTRSQSELVIIVTPHLVRPAPAGALTTPTDRFVPPSDTDIFLFGRIESAESGLPGSKGGAALSAHSAGGIEGSYGHIVK